MIDLTVEKAIKLAMTGEVIMWNAPAYKGNMNYKGKCRILDVSKSELNGSYRIHTARFSGDNLDFAKADNGIFWFSDADRFVTFQTRNLEVK